MLSYIVFKNTYISFKRVSRVYFGEKGTEVSFLRVSMYTRYIMAIVRN